MPTDNIKFALEFEKPVIELEKKITEIFQDAEEIQRRTAGKGDGC